MNEPTRPAERRARLVARAAAQRARLARELAPWQGRLARLAQGIAVVREIKRHPALWLGPVLLLAAWRPKAVGSWLGRVLAAWRFGRDWLRHCHGPARRL